MKLNPSIDIAHLKHFDKDDNFFNQCANNIISLTDMLLPEPTMSFIINKYKPTKVTSYAPTMSIVVVSVSSVTVAVYVDPDMLRTIKNSKD